MLKFNRNLYSLVVKKVAIKIKNVCTQVCCSMLQVAYPTIDKLLVHRTQVASFLEPPYNSSTHPKISHSFTSSKRKSIVATFAAQTTLILANYCAIFPFPLERKAALYCNLLTGLWNHSARTSFLSFNSSSSIKLGRFSPSQYSMALSVNRPQSWLFWRKKTYNNTH